MNRGEAKMHRMMWCIPLLGYTCLITLQLLPTQRRCITACAAVANHSCAHSATMSASIDSSTTDVDSGHSSDAPQVEALFLIKFDKKVGWVARMPA